MLETVVLEENKDIKKKIVFLYMPRAVSISLVFLIPVLNRGLMVK